MTGGCEWVMLLVKMIERGADKDVVSKRDGGCG